MLQNFKVKCSNSKPLKYFVEIFLSLFPPSIFIFLNPYFRNWFPEEFYLLNNWNQFATLIPGFSNILDFERSFTSFSSTPDFIFSIFFDPYEPYKVLYISIYFRLVLVYIFINLLLRSILNLRALRIILFNVFFFQTSIIYSLVYSPRFYSIIMAAAAVVFISQIELFRQKKYFIYPLIVGALSLAVISNVGNYLSLIITIPFLILIVSALDIRFRNNLKQAKSYLMLALLFIPSFISIFYIFFFSSDIQKNRDLLSSGYFSISLAKSDLALVLSGAGQWSDYQGWNNIPYCTFCPSINYFLILRLSLIFFLLILAFFIITKNLGIRALGIVVSTLIVIILFASARLGLLYEIITSVVPYFTVFREPWSKFSHFIPLILIVLIAYSVKISISKSFDLALCKNQSVLTYLLIILITLILYPNAEQIFDDTRSTFIILTIFIIISLILFHKYVLILILIPTLYFWGAMTIINELKYNEEFVNISQKENDSISKALRFSSLASTSYNDLLVSQCYIFNKYSRESDFYYKMLRITPFDLESLNSPGKEVILDYGNFECLSKSSLFDEIFVPKTFGSSQFIASQEFKKLCQYNDLNNLYYFAKISCRKYPIHLINSKSVIPMPLPVNYKGLYFKKPSEIFVDSNDSFLIFPDLQVIGVNPTLSFSVKLGAGLNKSKNSFIDLHVENVYAGTITLDQGNSFFNFNIPFNSFEDGSISKISFSFKTQNNENNLTKNLGFPDNSSPLFTINNMQFNY